MRTLVVMLLLVLLHCLINSCGGGTTTQEGENHEKGDTIVQMVNDTVTVDVVAVTDTLVTSGFEAGHEWVDLGLPSGTRWATCNFGASSPTEYGDYTSWGENHAKDVFTWNNCEMYKIPVDKRPTNISGQVAYDPVTEVWGPGWCLPTTADFEELIQYTDGNRSWTTIDGVTGLSIVGPNGNAIFMPAAGYKDNQTVDGLNAHGSYWTANRATTKSKYVDYIALDRWGLHRSTSRIDHGRSIRPVFKPQ